MTPVSFSALRIGRFATATLFPVHILLPGDVFDPAAGKVEGPRR